MKEIEIHNKVLLTIEEAAAYSNIGVKKLRSMTDKIDCPFVLWNGQKRLIKKQKFDEYLNNVYTI
ncbi:MAG: helix-turn-helix domain-containing protein [Oscillospiraceae bacterium]|nr:helix-turn-helix domain-containing protein [Oscillospiraceae bacterium]